MRKSIRLTDFADRQGITYQTAHRWFKAGKIEGAYKGPTGAVFVYDDNENTSKDANVVIYCRVSNQSRKSELQYQVNRCKEFCNSRGYQVSKVFYEVASGMNDNRKQFWKMLDSKPTIIVVENKDRLTRFGFNYLDRLLKDRGCQVIVMNPNDNDEQDLIRDMISIVTSFCCRLYGLRRTKNKLARIKEVINEVASK